MRPIKIAENSLIGVFRFAEPVLRIRLRLHTEGRINWRSDAD
jgi:hypothetical protein